MSPEERQAKPTLIDAFVKWIAIPALVAAILIGVFFLLWEHGKALNASHSPRIADQFASNGILFASVLVSSVLAVLTYSIFRMTVLALKEVKEQTQAARDTAKATRDQADRVQEQLKLQTKSEERMTGVEERMAGADKYRANAFVDIGWRRSSAQPLHSAAPRGTDGKAQGDFQWQVYRRSVWDITRNSKRDPITFERKEEYDCDPQRSAFRLLLDKHHDALFALKEFIVDIPIRNHGNGAALDIDVSIQVISWSDMWIPFPDIAGGAGKGTDRKLIFDRLMPNTLALPDWLEDFLRNNYTVESTVREEPLRNISEWRTRYQNLFLAPHEEWVIAHPINVGESLLGYKAVYRTRHIQEFVWPDALNPSDVRGVADHLRGIAIPEKAFYGYVSERGALSALPGVSGNDFRDLLASRIKRNYDHNAVLEALRQRDAPLGLRVTIRYRNAVSIADDAKDETVYNLLLRESGAPGEESSLFIEPHLEVAENGIARLDKRTTLAHREQQWLRGQGLWKKGEGVTLFRSTALRHDPIGDCFPFAGINEEEAATERLLAFVDDRVRGVPAYTGVDPIGDCKDLFLDECVLHERTRFLPEMHHFIDDWRDNAPVVVKCEWLGLQNTLAFGINESLLKEQVLPALEISVRNDGFREDASALQMRIDKEHPEVMETAESALLKSRDRWFVPDIFGHDRFSGFAGVYLGESKFHAAFSTPETRLAIIPIACSDWDSSSLTIGEPYKISAAMGRGEVLIQYLVEPIDVERYERWPLLEENPQVAADGYVDLDTFLAD